MSKKNRIRIEKEKRLVPNSTHVTLSDMKESFCSNSKFLEFRSGSAGSHNDIVANLISINSILVWALGYASC